MICVTVTAVDIVCIADQPQGSICDWSFIALITAYIHNIIQQNLS